MNIPIIDFIQYDDVLIDILHLLIRISEKMFDSLIEKINQFERKQYGELDSRPVLNHFFEIFDIACGSILISSMLVDYTRDGSETIPRGWGWVPFYSFFISIIISSSFIFIYSNFNLIFFSKI